MQKKDIFRLTALLTLVCAILLPRISNLGTVFTTDESLWLSRAKQFMTGIATLQPHLTFTQVQPGVTTMWLAGLANRFDNLQSSQLAIGISTSILLFIGSILLIRLVGMKLGLLGAFLLALDPFLIAHSRVIHTDALMSVAFLDSLLLLGLTWKTKSYWYFNLAAFATGFAILSKISGAFLVLPSAYVAATMDGKQKIQKFIQYSIIAVCTIAILWPAVFTPKIFFNYAFKNVVELSQVSDVGKGGDSPFFYAREWFFRITPLTSIAFAVGLFVLLLNNFKQIPQIPQRKFWIFFLVNILLFGVAITFFGQKGDRYFLVGVMGADLIAAIGIFFISELLEKYLHSTIPWLTAICLTVAIQGYTILKIHPYELAYYNNFFPIKNTEKLGWGEGLEKAAKWISKNDKELPAITSYYSSVMEFWYPGKTDSIGHEYDGSNFKYVVLYKSMFGRENDSPESQYLKAYFTRGKCLHSININHMPFVWIFNKLPEIDSPNSSDAVSNQADLDKMPQCDSSENVG